MAKKMLTVKVDEELKIALVQISSIENRSQGGQIEYWIKDAVKKLKIKP